MLFVCIHIFIIYVNLFLLFMKIIFQVFFVLRTGLEPVISTVKGWCPNQLDDRSIFVMSG